MRSVAQTASSTGFNGYSKVLSVVPVRRHLAERETWGVITLCGVMMVVEIVAGSLCGSLALVADGLHMSTHAVSGRICRDLMGSVLGRGRWFGCVVRSRGIAPLERTFFAPGISRSIVGSSSLAGGGANADRGWGNVCREDHRLSRSCALCHRRTATAAQIDSTSPNGQAPCRNPYTEPSAQEAANARMNQGLRSSSA